MQQVTYYDQGAAASLGAHLFALRQRLPLLDDGAKTVWIHCAKPGEWKGHEVGEFAFDRATFDRIVANFERCNNPIPLTYEHPEHRGDDGIAAGWIHKLEVRSDGLWALAELTEKAAGHIRSGEYRFCSVVVDFESTDRETAEEVGPELYEIGLTNVPFIDGLSAIRLSRRASGTSHKELRMSIKDVLKEAAKELPDDATPEQLLKFVEGAMAKQEAVENKDGGKKEEPPAEASDKPAEEAVEANAEAKPEGEQRELAEDKVVDDQAMAVLEGLAQELSLDVPGLIAVLQERHDDVVKALGSDAPGEAETEAEATLNKTEEDGVKTVAASRVAALSKQLSEEKAAKVELTKRLEALEAQATEREVDDAITEGLFLDKDRDRLVKLARKDVALFREWRDEAKDNPAVPQGRKVVQAGPGKRKTDEADDGSDIDPEVLGPFKLAASRTFPHNRAKAEEKAIEWARDHLAGKSARA